MNAETIASLTTAVGTLVLAVATFQSVRSANRSSRVAETSLLAGIRPMLVQSRLSDPEQKVGFQDSQWFRLGGGRGIFEREGDVVYLAVAVRNAGTGIAMIQGWAVGDESGPRSHTPVEQFRMLRRDLLVAPGDIGFWQAALRDTHDPLYADFERARAARERVVIDVLYTDLHGGQRAITRFALSPGAEAWLATTSHHFVLDGPRPRD